MYEHHAQAPASGQRLTVVPRPRLDDLAGQPRSRRRRRRPSDANVIDLIFKISSSDGWSATLRNDPGVVLVAGTGDELAQLTRDLALAILQGHATDTLRAMRSASLALPAPDPAPPGPGPVSDERQPQDRDAPAGHAASQAS